MAKPINLEELRRGFAGKRYADLIQVHVNQQRAENLLQAELWTVEQLPPEVKPVVLDAIDYWNRQGYSPQTWRLDCAFIFDRIIATIKEALDEKYIAYDDEILFNGFQAITLNFAYYASSQRSMRKFIGIRKGIFG
jgi:hypothetical protein